jgi:hypothetical protein
MLSLSRDRGATWNAASNANFEGIAYHPHRAGAAYAWISDRLYRTNDLVNWTHLPLPANTILGIVEAYPDPQMPGQLWIATGQGLFRTLNDGISVTKVRDGSHRWIDGCGTIIAGTDKAPVLSSNGGKDWVSLPIEMDSRPAFGAACNGLALVRPMVAGVTRMYSERTEPNWSLSHQLPAGGGRLQVVRDGRGAVLHAIGLALRRFALDGTILQSYDVGGMAIVMDRIFSGSDGSVAGSGPEITIGGVLITAKFNAEGRRIGTARGTLLALDPLNRMVVVNDRGVEIWNDSGTLERALPLDSGTFALQYLPNGDMVAAGWTAPNKIWIARHRGDGPDQIWKTELLGPTAKPAGRVRLQLDSLETAFLEIPARVETRHPMVPQLAAAPDDRTFLRIRNDGEVIWSTLLPGRKFLNPQLFVVAASPESAQIERLTVPNQRLQAINTVLNADATALATAYAGETLVLKGHNLAPQMAEPGSVRAQVNGVAAQVVSASPDAVVIVVPPVLNGETAWIELVTPTGPVSPVEIPANR